MATFGGFFKGCPRQWSSFAYTKMRSIYNDNSDSCSTDLYTYGDFTGMKRCFQELGLDVPSDDSYHLSDEHTAIDVIDIF